MKRVVGLILAILMCTPAYGASQWTKTEPAGTTNASDIDYWVATINNEAIDRLLGLYRKNCTVMYSSAAELTVDVGEVAIPNAAGTTVRLRKNTAQTTVTWADIDAGAKATSTQYYVYALADTDTDATTFTIKVSTSASAPTGATYYRKIGYFYNNSNGNIVSVGNIAGGDAHNAVTATGTTDITNTVTASYSDMTDLTIYFIATGRPCRFTFSAPIEVNTQDSSIISAQILDGTTTVCSATAWSNAAAADDSMGLPFHLETVSNLSSGAHTIKVQWKTSVGQINQSGASIGIRTLTVEEL